MIAARNVMPVRWALVLGTWLLGACGGTAPQVRETTELERRSVQEAEAIDRMAEALTEAGVPFERAWRVDIGGDTPLSVDVRLDATSFGIEWVSAADRERHGDELPEPEEGGQLRIVAGRHEERPAQVLVLDHRSYRYDPNRKRVQRGAIGIREAESRIRRDVRDYLEYVRGQGAL